MAITGTDIQFFLSGGSANADPNAALGGAISSTQITDASDNNLFDDVSGDESSVGDTEYRAFFVKNNHATLTWQTVKAWIQTNTPAGDGVEIGIEASSGSPKQTIANESTAPTGITFSAPATKNDGLAVGNMAAGVVYMVWVKRIVPGSTAAYNANSFILKFEGDSAA